MLKKIFIKEIVGPIIVILFFYILYMIIKKIMKKSIKLQLSKVDLRRKKTITNILLNIIKYLFVIIAILIILSIYGINTSAIITSLGVVGVVVGLGFQDIIKDFLSGISIIIENQFTLGDTVTINNFKGEVIFLGLKTTRLKAYTGEIKIISNRNIQEVINHSLGMSLAIIDIPVSYDEDQKKIEKILTDLCVKLTDELLNINGKVNLLGINSFEESAIVYRITVETKPMKHFEIQREILKQVKMEFDKRKLEIPYKQVVIHNA